MSRTALVLGLAAVVIAGCSAPVKGPADFVLLNAKVATVDEDFNIERAIAVADGNIVAVGDDNRCRRDRL